MAELLGVLPIARDHGQLARLGDVFEHVHLCSSSDFHWGLLRCLLCSLRRCALVLRGPRGLQGLALLLLPGAVDVLPERFASLLGHARGVQAKAVLPHAALLNGHSGLNLATPSQHL
eukprot:502213-Pyramimonas_sp.AAC.1